MPVMPVTRYLVMLYWHHWSQLKMRILRFVVHSVLVTKYYQASKTQHQIWRNIWGCSTVKFTEQVPPGGVKQRAASKATASTGPRPPKQQKLDFGAKQVSGGELKKLVWRYAVEEMLHLNKVDSPSFGAIINKSPAIINAMLGVTVKNVLAIQRKLAKLVVFVLVCVCLWKRVPEKWSRAAAAAVPPSGPRTARCYPGLRSTAWSRH